MTSHLMSSSTHSAAEAKRSAPAWQIKLLYDGECPLCQREVNFLRRRDAGRGLIAFVDIAAEDYNPDQHGGIDFATAMGRIHALLPDGTILRNMEVFRRIYNLLGLGWIYAPTRLPLLRSLADWVYGLWADWRLALTGRPPLATLMEQRHCRTGERCRLQDPAAAERP
jgi:predicted DCC family thiol-disulfide oxidoreductase YuxK